MDFGTPLVLSGPLRRPRQMLAEQSYDGHASLHDDSMAGRLGFQAGPIEGPTHFSQFEPLMARIWGREWFERGCFSAHFRNMVFEGEEVRALAEMPAEGATRTGAWAEKADGTPVLEASASLGEGPTLLEERMAKLSPPGPLVILEDLEVGMTGRAEERVRMEPEQHMGSLYPFSLDEKLERITEAASWSRDASASPWGRRAIPLEMVSVLAQHTNREAGFPVKGPAVGLFADLEIRMIDGPLLAGEDYVITREVVALSESRRTESCWVRSRIRRAADDAPAAEVLLNHAVLKDSYQGYAAARARREAAA